MTQNTPPPELKRLDVLVGHWHSSGQTIATPDSPSIKILGTDTYEWFPGGFFLVHRVKVTMGEEQIETLEMIGSYDEANQTYPMRSFDHAGQFATMQARVDAEGVWTFTGESIRATLTIAPDRRTMAAHWEQTTDGTHWKPWMDMTFTKDAEASPADILIRS